MDSVPPAVVRVLSDPREPGRFKRHLFDADGMPLNPVIVSEGNRESVDAARVAGEDALKRHMS